MWSYKIYLTQKADQDWDASRAIAQSIRDYFKNRGYKASIEVSEHPTWTPACIEVYWDGKCVDYNEFSSIADYVKNERPDLVAVGYHDVYGYIAVFDGEDYAIHPYVSNATQILNRIYELPEIGKDAINTMIWQYPAYNMMLCFKDVGVLKTLSCWEKLEKAKADGDDYTFDCIVDDFPSEARKVLKE